MIQSRFIFRIGKLYGTFINYTTMKWVLIPMNAGNSSTKRVMPNGIYVSGVVVVAAAAEQTELH